MSTDGTLLYPHPVEVSAEAVPEGKVIDFLTGAYINDTPEEYVRQNVERDLISRFGYPVELCQREFRIKVGSSRNAVDIAVLAPGTEPAQENINVIIECKKPGTSPASKQQGIGQLKSYMAACINATYGVWTNGDDRYAIAKRQRAGGFGFDEIVEIPAYGQSEADAQRPKRKDLKPATATTCYSPFVGVTITSLARRGCTRLRRSGNY